MGIEGLQKEYTGWKKLEEKLGVQIKDRTPDNEESLLQRIEEMKTHALASDEVESVRKSMLLERLNRVADLLGTAMGHGPEETQAREIIKRVEQSTSIDDIKLPIEDSKPKSLTLSAITGVNEEVEQDPEGILKRLEALQRSANEQQTGKGRR